MSKTVCFRAIKWDYRSLNDDHSIYITGLDKHDVEVMVKVVDFRPYIYLELPKVSRYTWNKTKVTALLDILKTKYPNIGFKGIKYLGTRIGLQGSKVFECAIVYMSSYQDCGRFESKIHDHISGMSEERRSKLTPQALKDFIRRGEHNPYNRIPLPGDHRTVVRTDFTVHEARINPEIKMTSLLGLKMSGWLKVKGDVSDIGKCYTLEASYKNIANADIEDIVQVHPKVLSFDLECDSHNHNSKIPDPDHDDNPIVCIGNVFYKMGSQPYRRIALCLGKPVQMEGMGTYEIESFETEKQMLIRWCQLIDEEDPFIFTGHNIYKFDWPYLLTRLDKCGVKGKLLAVLDRLYGVKADVKHIRWTSSAYAEQVFDYPDGTGRLNIDTYIEFQRNPVVKLTKFSLEEVSSTLLGEHKEDLKPQELFRLCLIWRTLWPLVSNASVKHIKERMRSLLSERKCTGKVGTVRADIFKAKDMKEMKTAIRTTYSYITRYCIQDCALVQKIGDKIDIWNNMQAMSNVTCVPMSYLHTRGQIIKVVAKVVRITLERGMVISRVDTKLPPYEGAVVVNTLGKVGYMVGVGDFSSLYPSIMISLNVSPDAEVLDDSVPDSECNVSEWEDHRGCKHDMVVHKPPIKPDKVLCGKRKTRYRRVVVREDGSLEGEGVISFVVKSYITDRKVYKKEMLRCETLLTCHEGKADKDTLKVCEVNKWPVYSKGELTPEQVTDLTMRFRVSNAMQNADKLAANSSYGGFGADTSPIRNYNCASTVTANGRKFIRKAQSIITEDHGVPIIYGDTDSTMMEFGSIPPDEAHDKTQAITRHVTHVLKCMLVGVDPDKPLEGQVKKQYDALPLNLDFERMFKFLILFKKKRYIALPINRDGKEGKLLTKGIVLVRRDNAQITRDIYTRLKDHMLDMLRQGKGMEDIYDNIKYHIVQEAYNLYAGIDTVTGTAVPDTKWVIYTGIKSVIDYAAKNKSGQYVDYCDKDIKDTNARKVVTNVSDPLDPRLDYSKAPSHVQLALRMMRRGDVVPPNTRLEYVVTNVKSDKVGDKVEDLDYYRENNEEKGLTIDKNYYWENRISTQIQELLRVLNVEHRAPHYKYVDILKEWVKTIDYEWPKGCRSMEAKLLHILSDKHLYRRYGKVKWDNVRIKVLLDLWRARRVLERLCTQHGVKTPQRTLPPMESDDAGKKVRCDYIVVDHNLYDQIALRHRQHAQLMTQLRNVFSPVQVGDDPTYLISHDIYQHIVKVRRRRVKGVNNHVSK